MRWLALDQAPTTTGWAIGSALDRGRPKAGTFVCPDLQTTGERLFYFGCWIRMAVLKEDIQAVAFEGPFLSARTSAKTQRAMCSFADHVLYVCADLQIPALEVSCQEWRKHFIGRANAPKEIDGGPAARRKWLKDEAIRSCVERGWDVRSDESR